MIDVARATEKLKVFVSYSEDVQFAEQLVLALQERGFEPLIDRYDIDPGEEWKTRLYDLIFGCDTVAFVLSKRSALSPTCAWEVKKARDLGKRMVPVVIERVGGVTVPPQLSDLNYIYFYPEPTVPGSGFYDGVIKFDSALRVDLAWLREATRLSEMAADWKSKGQGDQLLRGTTLREAQDWLEQTPTDTEVQPNTLDFLVASADSEKAAAEKMTKTERKLRRAKTTHRSIIASAALAVVVIGGFAGIAWWLTENERTWTSLRIWGLAKLGLYGGPEMIEIRPGQSVFPANSLMEQIERDIGKPMNFKIGRYEITFDEYAAYTFDQGLDQPSDDGWGHKRRPVINVSWDDVQGYIKWLRRVTKKPFRLPSNTEWVYAARAGTKTSYWWGNQIEQDGTVWAHCRDCGSWDEWTELGETVPVGQFPPNPFGLFDTAGNVSEWVEDCLNSIFRISQDDVLSMTKGDCDYRLFRGSSWAGYLEDYRQGIGYGDYGAETLSKSYSLGFRLAQDLPD